MLEEEKARHHQELKQRFARIYEQQVMQDCWCGCGCVSAVGGGEVLGLSSDVEPESDLGRHFVLSPRPFSKGTEIIRQVFDRFSVNNVEILIACHYNRKGIFKKTCNCFGRGVMQKYFRILSCASFSARVDLELLELVFPVCLRHHDLDNYSQIQVVCGVGSCKR